MIAVNRRETRGEGRETGATYSPGPFGPCCACGATCPTVRNFMFLEQKAPVPGTGWGCCVCGLPADGAVAVLCDACIAAKRPPVLAFAGYPSLKQFVAVADLVGEHKHDLGRHQPC